jgi:DNA gyrase subunit A
MAKPLDISPTGRIEPTALHTEMQQSYLEYAMSVIVGRALPDVRDGLKPVHRRILYAMHELGLTPDRPYRKCARVVGDVLGKYHPHGDQSVYDALVRLVQEFSSRYPLLAGHGNFGSVDNDPPAAMRYTETRLALIGNVGMLTEIGDTTVDFVGNFDNSQQEPTVLPAQLPFLLLNGSSGIAVGMATNIPPHNLGEVVDGLIALIDRPSITDEEMLAIIPGPDFPTGGEIYGTDGIWEAYTTGRGSVPVRGVTSLEEVNLGKGRHRRTAIIVTELPFQVNKAGLIEKIAELVNAGKIEGIADLRDESDRDGIRIVIELRRDGVPDTVLEKLYRLTPLQTNFGCIFLALSNNQPHQMTLRELMTEFLAFREETLTKRYRHEFEQASSRQHIVEGWITALDNIERVIDILRNAPDGTTAKAVFQAEMGFTDRQSDAILSMPLRRLTGLERQNLQAEFTELTQTIAELQRVLSDRKELLKALKKDLRSLKKQFGDARRTRIVQVEGDTSKRRTKRAAPVNDADVIEVTATASPEQLELNTTPAPASPASAAKVKPAAKPAAKAAPAADSPQTSDGFKLTPPPIVFANLKPIAPAPSRLPAEPDGKAMVLEFVLPPAVDAAPDTAVDPDADELDEAAEACLDAAPVIQVRRMIPKTFRDSNRDLGAGVVVQTEPTAIGQTLILITGSGKAYPLPIKAIPRMELAPEGTPLNTLLPASAQADGANPVIFSFFLPADLEDQFMILVTQQGKIKRLPLAELQELTSRGSALFKLKDDDQVQLAGLANPGDQVILAASSGRVIRFDVSDDQLPVHNRNSPGLSGMRITRSEHLVGMAITGTADPFLLVSAEGYAKRITTGALKLSNPGDLGMHVFQFSSKGDRIVGMTPAFPEEVVVLRTSAGRARDFIVDDAPLASREHKGDLALDLEPEESVEQVIWPQLSAVVAE